MGGRRDAISAKKVKNNPLAAVLILAVVHPSVKIGEEITQKHLRRRRDVTAHTHHIVPNRWSCPISPAKPCCSSARECSFRGSSGRSQKWLLLSATVLSPKHMPPPAIGEVWKAFMAFFAGLFQRLTDSIARRFASHHPPASHESTGCCDSRRISGALSICMSSSCGFQGGCEETSIPTREVAGAVRATDHIACLDYLTLSHPYALIHFAFSLSL
ncbi:hypothetical protein B0H14DRAFT_308705 [Mycena olivaceomarginata]|nr:hypothetical protein B0H14DRAFT_308705 [Mycena olivaceomarginata]